MRVSASSGAAWEARRAEHREAVERVLADIRRLDDDAWLCAPAADKWCPGQVAEHLVLSYDALLRELAGEGGMRIRPSWWRRQWIRLRFLPMLLNDDRMPEEAPAVRELRPPSPPRPRPVVVDALRERAERFDLELTRGFEAGGGTLTHPFFGKLRAPQVLRFVAVHLEHHRKQIASVKLS